MRASSRLPAEADLATAPVASPPETVGAARWTPGPGGLVLGAAAVIEAALDGDQASSMTSVSGSP